jgi:PKHD-type hydroxylase
MIISIPPRNPIGKNNLAYWEDFLSNDEINLILAQPEWMSVSNAVVGGQHSPPIHNSKVRNSEVAWLQAKPELQEIWIKLANTVAEVNRNFFHYDLTGFHEPMQLGVYQGGSNGHYDWHCDAAAEDLGVPRKLSMVLLLSDPKDFEGGELQLMNGDNNSTIVEQKRGRAWFFPSWMLHRVTPVTKGIRRSAVLWIGGPAFK